MSNPNDINETIKAFTPIVGILCVSIVAVEAFNHGLDGTLWAATTGAICILAGYKAPQLIQKLKS